VTTHTSDVKGAGTDANVFVDIKGAQGASGPQALRTKGNPDPFKKGKTDSFELLLPLQLGELLELGVWHDGKGLGAGWHLDFVEVADVRANKVSAAAAAAAAASSSAACSLSYLSAPELLRLVLFLLLQQPLGLPRRCWSSCAANSPLLRPSLRRRAPVGQALQPLPCVPPWPSLSLQTCTSPADSIMPSLGPSFPLQVWYFSCRQWLDSSQGDKATRRQLPASSKDPRGSKAQYLITTTTSDIRGAGTDAAVFIVVYGTEGDTGRKVLDNPGR
jgi:hypothetical protein